MTRSVTIAAAMILALIAAVFLRVGGLGERPMHGDEGVNAVKFEHAWHGEGYRYDPHEFHGPTLPYSTFPAVWAEGAADFAAADKADFRVVAVVYGLIVVAVLLLAWRAIGPGAALAAGAFAAVSPAMVFFSRYYIHEMLLVAFTGGALWCGWWWWRRRSMAGAIACGVMVGLMHATKETFIITVFAAGVGFVLTALAESRRRGGAEGEREETTRGFFASISWGQVAVAAVAAIVVSVTLYSSFFTYWRGPLDSVTTYATWIGRGTGEQTPHVHPSYWYAQLVAWWRFRAGGMVWTEAAVIVFGLIGAGMAWAGCCVRAEHRAAARFMAVYTLALWVVYSLIPYKTPWSILTAWHGLIVLAGIGAAGLVRGAPWMWARGAFVVVIVACLGHLGFQSYRAAYDPVYMLRNPWVYAHPSRGVEWLAERVEQIGAVADEGADVPVMIIKADNHYWPLPYYLRRMSRVGYLNEPPQRLAGVGIVIVDEAFAEGVYERLGDTWHADTPLMLPPDVHLMVYIRGDLWERFMAGRR